MVSLYQSALSQEIWNRAIFGKDIATGLGNTTSETGTTGDGTFESLPRNGMDPGPFLSLNGTMTVTAMSPSASATSSGLILPIIYLP